jgi:hypothetical protein
MMTTVISIRIMPPMRLLTMSDGDGKSLHVISAFFSLDFDDYI